jgi:D-alanyl-D-alanine carboxypeptidase/D-alanyl-D-alanine-endopeptidase (penicillin-binding protein 4)
VATPSVSFTADAAPELRAAVEEALRLPVVQGARTGLYAATLSGQPVLRLNEDAQLNPASCVKLVTTATALKTLRPEYRFRTEYLAHGEMDGSTLKGDLVVRGVGDPTITQARLYGVASELAARGIRTVTGDLVLDDTHFDRVWEGAGWEQEVGMDRAYAAQVGALSVDANVVTVWVRPGDRRGAPATVQLEPPGESLVLEKQVVTVRYGRRLWVRTFPDGDRTRVVVQGVLGVQEPAERVVRRIYNPTGHFGSTFLSLLAVRGITVKGKARPGVTPEGARLIVADASPRLQEVVTTLNQHSNNFVAEMLLKAVGAHVRGAPGTTQKGILVAQEMLERDVGLAPGSYILGNGSGLNDVNRFSAAQLVQLVRRMAQDSTVAPEFVGSLGVAGASGTLGHRMVQTAAERQLRGKTGTLAGVSALTGVVESPRHGPVFFSILVNGVVGPASAAWEVQDRIGAAMAGDPDPAAVVRRGGRSQPGNQAATAPPDGASPGGGGPW